ncbi:MAG: DUF445 family protein [Leptospiraceae bacterium]|nr:DUF445 family protein [Leptospiraceae bacterium]MCP5499253.1 DUF445 family protein [Leptospiraceae bacterium]
MMPFTYGFVGWFTNWVALKMTFYPLKFWGIPPYIGWQGIIPRKAHKMASKSVDIITTRLLKIEEVFDRVEPEGIESELKPILSKMIREVTQDIVNDINPNLWSILPDRVKQEIYTTAEAQIPGGIRTIIMNVRKNIYQVFDIKGLVLKSLTGDNVTLIVEMFQSIGAPEFKFIERSGFYFGFLLGLIQMIFWLFFPIWWTLPIQGIIVGYLTNWLAINMIFRPLYEKKYLGFIKYQGLFLKRQDEVAKQYAHMVATRILTARAVLKEIFYGKAADEVYNIVQSAAIKAVENTATSAQPIISLTIGPAKYQNVKKQIIDRMMEIAPRSIETIEEYVSAALDFEKTMYEKMRYLDPPEFESVLRSAFQEDELLLILIGAVLGAMVGLGQAISMVM